MSGHDKSLFERKDDVELGSCKTTVGTDETTDEASLEQNHNVVDWEDSDDPENPKNWPEKAKWLHIGLISAMAIVT